MGVITYSTLFAVFLSVTSGKEFVPVLIWGTSKLHVPHQGISGLSRVTTDEFLDYMQKNTEEKKPVVIVFMEENISLEDLSWRDMEDNGAFLHLSNISKSSSDSTFMPSVHNPYKALRKLRDHGYSWHFSNSDLAKLPQNEAVVLAVKLNEPGYYEDRPDMLRNHDEEIYSIYNQISSQFSHVLAIYTGHHSSWTDADIKYNRVKRDNNDPPSENEIDILVRHDQQNQVLIASERKILLERDGKFENITLEKARLTSNPGDNFVDLKFNIPTTISSSGKIYLDLNFTGDKDSSWKLSSIWIDENKELILTSSVDIYGYRNYSFFCKQPVIFTTPADVEKKVTLTFNYFQIQPFYEDVFGPPIDCVPYFSTGIWSGIFIVFILTAVLAWGIVMIMDINTMDRFDDPKGKTITISATD